jgi:hypothetical protein
MKEGQERMIQKIIVIQNRNQILTEVQTKTPFDLATRDKGVALLLEDAIMSSRVILSG